MADWQVWRQDDNGQRFLVDSYAARVHALARVYVFEAGHPHKQLYEVVGDRRPGLRTNRDLYLALVGLGDHLSVTGRALLDYLCALWLVSRPLAVRDDLDGDEFAALLTAAATAMPVRPGAGVAGGRLQRRRAVPGVRGFHQGRVHPDLGPAGLRGGSARAAGVARGAGAAPDRRRPGHGRALVQLRPADVPGVRRRRRVRRLERGGRPPGCAPESQRDTESQAQTPRVVGRPDAWSGEEVRPLEPISGATSPRFSSTASATSSLGSWMIRSARGETAQTLDRGLRLLYLVAQATLASARPRRRPSWGSAGR